MPSMSKSRTYLIAVGCLAVGIAATLVVGSLAAQSSSRTQRPAPSTATAAKSKEKSADLEKLAGARPDPTNFKTYESYVEALLDWKNAQSAHTGRYQIVIHPSIRADTYLLDTKTGRTWQRTMYTDLKGDPEVWKILDRVDNDAELIKWIDKHEFKPKQPNP